MKQLAVKRYVLLVIAIMVLVGADIAIAGSKSKAPRGFKPFKTRQLEKAWIDPKFDASEYKTIAVRWTDFDYRKGLDKFSTRDRQENYNLSEQAKELLQKQADTLFGEELARSKNFKLINISDATSSTLVIQLTLTDITNKVPDRHQIVGSTDLFLRQFGAATLEVEIHDPTDKRLFFRGTDRDDIETYNFILERADMVTARRYSRLLFQRWSRGLRKIIDDI